MTTEQKVADAFRVVALKLEDAIERGRNLKFVDANDLLETLVSIADQLDPPVPGRPDPHQEVVDAARALLEAREDQMVTAVEWDRLQRAVDAAAPR